MKEGENEGDYKMKLDLKQSINTRASSGNIEKSFRTGYYIGLDWKINSQSTSSNSSSVTATVYIRTSGSGYTISSSASKDVSVTIDGTKYVSTCTVGVGKNTKKTLFTKTVTVKHNSDGSKTCEFACALDINVTLGGTYYGKITHSGSGVLDKINLNSAPTLSGSISLSPTGTVPENQSSVKISWNAGSDAQNNITNYVLYRYVNSQLNWSSVLGNVTSYTDNISSFGQGTKISYQIKARDSYGLESGIISSATITKNTLTPATATASGSIKLETTTVKTSWSGQGNTNGSGTFTYAMYSDDIRVYNNNKITSSPVTIAIVRSGETAPIDKPYLLFDDIKRFASGGTNWVRTATFLFETTNAYGSVKSKTFTIDIDLRNPPTKPTNATITGSLTINGSKYFIPSRKALTINWGASVDELGGVVKYDIYEKIGTGAYSLKNSNITSTTITLTPNITKSTTCQYKIVAKTTYGTQSEVETGVINLYTYSEPSIGFGDVGRTDETVTVTIITKANTTIPNIDCSIRRFKVDSGNYTNLVSTLQEVTITGLVGDRSYVLTVEVQDNTGLTGIQTATINIPSYTPLLSIRETGVGVGVIPTGKYNFEVKGTANIDGVFTIKGKPIELDTSNLVKKSDFATGTSYKGKVANIDTNGVMEIGQYIDFHYGSSTDDYTARLEDTNDSKVGLRSSTSLTATGQLNGHAINFTGYRNWDTGNFDNLGAGASIVNDAGTYQCLMILGSRIAGGNRLIKMWDDVTVTGTLTTNGDLTTKVLRSSNITTGNTQLINGSGATIYCGNPSTQLILESKGNPQVNIAGTTRTLYHNGNMVTTKFWSGALSGTSSITLTNGANYNYIIIGGKPGSASCECMTIIPRAMITTSTQYIQLTTEGSYIKFGFYISGSNVIIVRNAGSGNITMVYGGM